jgi:acetolactate synthase-1/2/3 large subunit
MGFGIPSALAASLNNPDKPVIALVGDGGFLMSAGEIMTARRYNINIKVVVLADRELNLIKLKQSWKGTDPYATTLLEGDMFGSDVFLGVPVLNACDTGSMQEAVRKALATAGPVIINATVPGDDYKELIVRQ